MTSNCHAVATAELGVKCFPKEFETLQRILKKASDEGSYHGFSVNYLNGDTIYLYADESCIPEALPNYFLKGLGELIKRHGLRYLEVGIAGFTDPKYYPDSVHGTRFRIYTDGEVVYSELTWPDYTPYLEDDEFICRECKRILDIEDSVKSNKKAPLICVDCAIRYRIADSLNFQES